MVSSEQALLDLIREAFDDVALEDGISLHEARAIDNYGSAEERRAARAQDTERSWQQIPDEVIEEYYDIFAFLDTKGFRYLLPAYMSWTVRNLKKSQSCSSEFIVYALMPRLSGVDRPKKSQLYEQLTPKQKKAAAQFLLWMEQTKEPCYAESATEALNDYWRQFSG